MNVKDIRLQQIRRHSLAEAEQLAGEFVRAASEEREAILAAMEFEKWLADSCADALADRPS